MRLFKKNSIVKSLCVFFFAFIFFFSLSFSCFAVETWKTVDTFQLGNLPFSSKSSDLSIRVKSDNSTNIYNNGSSVSLCIPYRTTSSWVSGNSYRLQFSVGAITSLTDSAFDIYLSNSLNDISNAVHLFDSSNSSVELMQGGIDINFTYSGESYLLFIVVLSSGSLLNISECYVNAYNPNAVQESQNQQIIEQNSNIQSGIDSQNSKLDEQNDFLYGDTSEDFSISDYDYSEELSNLDDNFNVLNEEIEALADNSRVKNALKAIGTIFDQFVLLLSVNDSTSIIVYAMFFNIFVSVLLIILNFIKSRNKD